MALCIIHFLHRKEFSKMGLIKAAIGSVGGTFADQWKEFFYCDAIDKDVIVVKGQKRTSDRSSNTKGNDNIISNGSVIAVADGQCMIIVEQGKVVEVCAEPGQFVYDTSTEPSIFAGNLGRSILDTFKTIGKRFTYGGDTGKDQRVYYFNTKELIDNKFGTANPVPFRVVDSKLGLDLDTALRVSGVYSYRITNPLLFYTNVCGNVEVEYNRSEIDTQLKTEFISALQPALGKLSELELRPNQIVAHNTELEDAMNQALVNKWENTRGIRVVSIALGSVTLPPEDAEMIKQLQSAAVLQNPTMAAAKLVSAQAKAMETAAGNSAGAMKGFMGMGMSMNKGGMNAQNLFAMGQQQQMQQPMMNQQMQQPMMNQQMQQPMMNQQQAQPVMGQQMQQAAPVQQAAPAQTAEPETWTCSCGSVNTGKFCQNCGTPKPQPQPTSWTCSCGSVNTGKFCQNCGTPRA